MHSLVSLALLLPALAPTLRSATPDDLKFELRLAENHHVFHRGEAILLRPQGLGRRSHNLPVAARAMIRVGGELESA